MEIGGYTGNILYVDLTRGNVRTERIHRDLIKGFLGGYGISNRLAYDLIKPGIDPLSPDNPIIIGTGPFTGTPVMVCSKIQVIYKYVLSGAIAHGSAAGNFGIMLKQAGYDHLVITGASDKWVYLHISNNGAELKDASHLWGKDTYEASDILYQDHLGASVITYGPAAEKLVKTTICFMDKVSPIGKGGMAPLMASKKLRALVAEGTGGIRIAYPQRLNEIMSPIFEAAKTDPTREKRIEMGTMEGFNPWIVDTGSSSKNYTEAIPVEEATRLFGPDIYMRNLDVKRISCPNCPMACKEHIRIKEGEFAGLETYASSIYGRTQNFGTRCRVGNINRIVKLLDFCNRNSVCAHNSTALIEWAVDLYKRGILTKEDTGGLDLDWDYETTAALLQQIANNEGLGGILGKGFYGAIKAIGRGCDKHAVHCRGLEPLFEPRLQKLTPSEFYMVVGPRGGHIALGGLTFPYLIRGLPMSYFMEWAQTWGVPKSAKKRIFSDPSRFNTGRFTVWCDIRAMVESALGIGCTRGRVSQYYAKATGGGMQTYVELYKAVTGLEATIDDFISAGDRIGDLVKVLNLREGWDRKEDKFPSAWFEPIMREGKKVWLEDYFENRLTQEDCERMLDDYYDERGWDTARGVPTKEKLARNGLSEIAVDMEKQGYLGTRKPVKE